MREGSNLFSGDEFPFVLEVADCVPVVPRTPLLVLRGGVAGLEAEPKKSKRTRKKSEIAPNAIAAIVLLRSAGVLPSNKAIELENFL